MCSSAALYHWRPALGYYCSIAIGVDTRSKVTVDELGDRYSASGSYAPADDTADDLTIVARALAGKITAYRTIVSRYQRSPPIRPRPTPGGLSIADGSAQAC